MGQEALLKLNPNGVNFDHIAGGGPSLIDREALIWCLGGSSRSEFALANLLVLGDESYRSTVKNGLFMAGSDTPEYLRFRVKNKHCMDALCILVVEEYIDQPRCKPCGGTGVNASYEPCPKCGGLGNKPKSLRARTKLFNKNHRCWYQFEAMHSVLVSILHSWTDSNNRKLKKRAR